MICQPWASTCSINLPTKFKLSISTKYNDMKDDTQYQKWGGLG